MGFVGQISCHNPRITFHNQFSGTSRPARQPWFLAGAQTWAITEKYGLNKPGNSISVVWSWKGHGPQFRVACAKLIWCSWKTFKCCVEWVHASATNQGLRNTFHFSMHSLNSWCKWRWKIDLMSEAGPIQSSSTSIRLMFAWLTYRSGNIMSI